MDIGICLILLGGRDTMLVSGHTLPSLRDQILRLGEGGDLTAEVEETALWSKTLELFNGVQTGGTRLFQILIPKSYGPSLQFRLPDPKILSTLHPFRGDCEFGVTGHGHDHGPYILVTSECGEPESRLAAFKSL